MQDKYMREMVEKVASPNRVLYIANTIANGAHTLEVYQTEVHIDSDASYTETLTLPSVVLAKGLTYSIRTEDTGGHTTIQDQDDSTEWSDRVTDADNEFISLYSDGQQWHIVHNDMGL